MALLKANLELSKRAFSVNNHKRQSDLHLEGLLAWWGYVFLSREHVSFLSIFIFNYKLC